MKDMYKTPPNTTVRPSLNQSSPSPSANRLAVQMSYMERRYDEILGKVLDQNAMILSSVSRMQEDIKNLRTKLESLEIAAQEEPITKPSSSSSQVNGVDSLKSSNGIGGGINENTLHSSSQGIHSQWMRGLGGYNNNGHQQLPSPYHPQQQQQQPYFYNPYAHPMYANPFMMMPPMTHDPMSLLNPLYGAAAMFDRNAWNANAFAQEDNKSQEPFKTSLETSVPIAKPTTILPEVVADRSKMDQVTTNAHKISPITQSQPQVVSAAAAAAAPRKDFSELFKKPEGEWNCNTCYSPNKKESFTCVACQTPKSGTAPPPVVVKPKETSVTSSPKFTFGFSTPSSSSSTTTTTSTNNNSTSVTTKSVTISTTTTTTPISKPPPVVNLFSSPTVTTPSVTSTSILATTLNTPSTTTITSKIPTTAAFTWTASTFSPSTTTTTTTPIFGKPSTPVIQNKDTKPSETTTSTFPDFGKLSEKFQGFDSVAPSNTTTKVPFSGGFQFPTTIQPAIGVVGSPNAARVKSTTSGIDSTDSHREEIVDEFVPTAEFEPVIPLPPLVEVVKGDENENVLFQHRAKLLRFVKETKEWKERGLGEIKILQAKDNLNKIRIVMWREKVHKIACNHWVTKDLEITNYQGNLKALMWTAVDFAEEDGPKTEIFVCRFGQEDKAQEFKREMEKSITLVKNAPDTPEKPKKEQSNSDKKEQPPKELPKLSDVYKRPEGEWNCSACYSPNKKENLACAACTTPKPGHTPVVSSQPSKEAVTTPPKFSFGFSTPAFSTPTTSTSATPIATSTVTSTPSSKPVFGFTGFGSPAISSTTTTTATPKTEGGSIFTLSSNAKSVTPAFSWAPTTTTTPTTPSQQQDKGESKGDDKKGPDFSKLSEKFQGFDSFASATVVKPFSGHGFQTPATIKPVFGSFSSPVVSSSSNGVDSAAADSSRHEEVTEEFVPTAEFEPVIPLPPLVEVVKGDENENVLFQHRAKLLRFVKETKEWKERGLGEIKILQAKDNLNKIRIVMWREKVHKIACNHWVTKDLEITNYQGNLKALMWTAVDFAEEDGPKTEIFVCRFGQEDKAQEFKREMENAVTIVKNSPDSPERPKEVTSSSNTSSQSVKPLSQLFKKPEGEWNCDVCYCSNNKDSLKCLSCETPKPGSSTLPNAGGDATNEGKNTSDLNEKAESLQLPSNILMQESDKPNDHDHCRGCDVETFDFSILDGREVPNFEDIPKPQRPAAENQNETLKDLLTKNTAPKENTTTVGTKSIFGGGISGIHDVPATVENLSLKTNGDNDNEEQGEGGGGEEEDDEEDEEDQMFESENAHAYVREEPEGEFVDHGEGSARILYDGDQYCARLVFQSHTTDDFLEHYIATETTVQPAGENTFEWDFISLTNGSGVKNRIRVIFPDQQACSSFSKIMAESVDMAMKIGVTEQDLRDDVQQNHSEN